ncbi:hypothetical protein [Anaerotignum faecicola]|uniref:Uncharacterized protein n=1 Tax=Anaerotignum faecicola TaxID=2358141 RepID=A0A401LFF6_9FIRM|nr:hypothetical protein [Anaerotignum faecicola]GCB30280.1 hypothetical protein KGMB03357_19410 [Anaerotignum faecicola]
MEVKKIKNDLASELTKESGDAATVTISDISLYMSRSLAAGAYDLHWIQKVSDEFMDQAIWLPWSEGRKEAKVKYQYYNNDDNFKHVVKEGFVQHHHSW